MHQDPCHTRIGSLNNASISAAEGLFLLQKLEEFEMTILLRLTVNSIVYLSSGFPNVKGIYGLYDQNVGSLNGRPDVPGSVPGSAQSYQTFVSLLICGRVILISVKYNLAKVHSTQGV